MAQKENRIQFSIDFKKGETHALDSLKKDLAEIQNMATKPMDLGLEAKEIQRMVSAARTLETSLDQAFDVDLNTVNIQKFNNLLKQSGMSAESLQADLSLAGATGQQAFLKMTGQLMQFNTMTKQTNKFLDGLATSFFNTVKWGIMSSVMNNISGTIQKSFYYIKDLDRGLNDIRIVTGKSADEMERFAVTANDAAKALSVSTEDFTKGALIYYQQGLDDETATQLAEITAKTANVTGQSMDAVSEELTAVWNGYQVANRAAEEGMQVYEEYVDKMAAVGATTASDLEELSVAMSKVASAAAAMGVDFDDLNAQIATIVSVTRQAPESVGTALKTIYARLGDLKIDGVDEFGVKLGEVSQQLQDIGIDVLDDNGNLRDMSEVIKEVASAWGGWTEAQRQAAAVAMAGKRQYNNLIALFDNWDMHEKALATSMGAVGTLSQQQAIAAESLAKKMEKMSATAEDLYGNLFDEDSLIKLVEFGTDALQFLADFTESIGGLKSLLPAIGSLALQVFNEQIGRGLSTIVINAQNAIQQTKLMEDNFEQIKLMFSENAMFSIANSPAEQEAMNQALQNVKSYYEEMYQYQSIMTKEEKEQYNLILNTKVEAGNLAVQIAQQTESQKNANESFKLFDGSLINSTQDAQKLRAEADKINLAAAEIKEHFDEHTFDFKKFKDIGNFDKSFKKFLNGLDLAKEKVDVIYQRFKDINHANLKTAKKDVQQLVSEMENLGAGALNIDKNRAAIDKMTNSTNILNESLVNTVSIEKQISNVSKAVGALGQLATSINTLSNIGNIQTNDDLSTGEKLTQTVMNLSFAFSGLAMTIKTFSEFTYGAKVFNALATGLDVLTAKKLASNAADASKIAFNKIMEPIQQRNIKDIYKLITAEEFEAIATNKQTAADIIQNKTQKTKIVLTDQSTAALELMIDATIKDTAATEAKTVAQNASNAAHMAALGPIAAVIAAIAAAVVIYQVYNKTLVENAKKAIEQTKAKQEEIKANQELYDSYNKTLQAYEKGNASKEDLLKSTESVCDAYDIEINKLDVLNEKYDNITAAINRKRAAELEDAQANLKQQAENQATTTFATAREGRGQKDLDGQYKLDLYKELSFDTYDSYLNALFRKNVNENYLQGGLLNRGFSGGGASAFSIESGNMEQMLELYDQLNASAKEYIDLYGQQAATESGEFQALEEQLNRVGPEVEEYRNTINELQESEAMSEVLKVDFSDVDTLSAYNDKLKEVEVNLRQVLFQSGMDAEEASQKAAELAQQYVSQVNDTTKALQEEKDVTEAIAEKTQTGLEEVQAWQNRLDPDEKKLILSGQIDFDYVFDTDDIEKRVELAMAQAKLETFDVSQMSGIASTLVSGKKLTKSDNETLSSIAAENPSAMAGLDDKSVIHQLEVIDEITQYQIQKNEEYLQNTKEVLDQRIKIEKEAQEEIFKTEEEYNQAVRKLQGVNGEELSDEERERIQAKVDAYTELQLTIEDLQEKAEQGLSFGEIEDIGFNSLVTNLDLVETKLDTIKSAAELVGEGFTVAASDVEKFSEMFPEMLEGMEILSDGSMKLSQETVQNNIEGIKAELEARTQAKIEEVDQQIQLKELEQEYLQEKLNALTDYLDGVRGERYLEDRLYAAGQKYRAGLMDLTGQDIAELTKFAIDSSKTEGENIVNMLNQIGAGFSKAAAAHYAMLHGDEYEQNDISFSGTASSASEYAANKGEAARNRLNAITEESYAAIYAEAQEVQANLNTVTGELDKLRSERAVLESSLNASMHALDNVAAGKAGKDSKDKGGKDAKSKDEKEYRDEFNRYFDIEKAIEDVDHAVKQLEKDQKNLHGKGLIESLQKENELIEKQTENYEKLYELQKEEAKELIGKLKGLGLTFDDSGAITNYAEATKKALDDYNKAVAQYNADQNDEVFEIHEKAYENFKKTLERYESLYYKEMKDTQDKIDDNNRKILENNLKGWEVEIELRLETNKMERDWNNFLRKITKDYKKVFKDLGQEMQDLIAQTGELEKDQAVYLDELDDITAEIDKMVAGEGSDMFENIDQAKEKLKELYDQIISNGEDIYDLQQEAWDNYLDSIDQAADKFDVIEDGWKRVNDELEFEKQLIELIYGEKAYDLMDTYYKGQEGAMKGEIESLKATSDMWHKLQVESGATMDNQLDQTEDQQKYYEQQQEAQQGLNDKLIDYIKLLKDGYLNTVNKILDEVEKKIFGSGGLDAVKQQQEKIKQYSDKYYDDVEKAYEITKLTDKYNKAIKDTDDVNAQKKLIEARDKMIKSLSQENKLSKYRIDYETKFLEVLEKENALEEAKNNKTSMKLTRNAQGNQSYQYVADEEDIEDKKQELLDAQADLYELSKKAMEENIEEALKLYEDFTERLLEIQNRIMNGEITNEEGNQQAEALLEDFGERFDLIGEENNVIDQDLAVAAAGTVQTIQKQMGDDYEAFTTDEQNLTDMMSQNNILTFSELRNAIESDYQGMGTSAHQFLETTNAEQTSSAAQIISQQNSDDDSSVKNQLNSAIESIKTAGDSYQDKMEEIGKAVGIVLVGEEGKESIKSRIIEVEEEQDRLGKMTEALTIATKIEIDKQKSYLDELEGVWRTVEDAVRDAISAIDDYLEKVAKAGVSVGVNVTGDIDASSIIAKPSSISATATKKGKGGGKTPPPTEDEETEEVYTIRDSYTGEIVAFTRDASKASDMDVNSEFKDDQYYDSVIKEVVNKNDLKNAIEFATGGYTGNWGSDEGRLAVLHEKELVLNEKDTDNLLEMIKMIKYSREEMLSDFQEMEYMLHKSVAKMQAAQAINSYKDYINAIGNMAGGPVSGDTFYIDRLEFPNANSVDEIREAILTLPNIASQFVGRNTK